MSDRGGSDSPRDRSRGRSPRGRSNERGGGSSKDPIGADGKYRSVYRENGLLMKDLFSVKVDRITDNVTNEDLAKTFSEFGVVQDVYIPRDFNTDRSKGFGFVRFEKEDEAEDAANAKGIELDGKEVDLCIAEKAKRESKGKGKGYDSKGFGKGSWGKGYDSWGGGYDDRRGGGRDRYDDRRGRDRYEDRRGGRRDSRGRGRDRRRDSRGRR